MFLLKQWWMPLDEYCPSIELHRTVAVVTKTSTVHHVEQVVLRRAPAASSKLWRPDCSSLRRPGRALCSPHLSLPSIMFCPFLLLFSPLTLTHRMLPREMRGVTVNHRWGVWKNCVCVWVCMQARTHVCFMGDSGVWAVKPEKWAEEEKERSSSSSSSSVIETVYRAETLSSVPFSPPPLAPWGDTTAAPDTEHLPLTDTMHKSPVHEGKGPYRTLSDTCMLQNNLASIFQVLQCTADNWTRFSFTSHPFVSSSILSS